MRKMKGLMGLLVLSLVFPVLVSAASLPWAEYGANAQNTGQSPYVGPQTTEYNWKVALGGDNRDSFVSPVVDASGTIYLLDDAGSGWWEYVNDQWVYHQPDKPAPSVKAVSKSGIVKWEKEVAVECEGRDGATSLALGTNGLLYLYCGRGQVAYDGQESWYLKGAKLSGIETDTGRTRWELLLDDYMGLAVGSMTVDSLNRVYFVAGYKNSPADYWPQTQAITAVSDTGAILWRTILGEGGGWDIAGPVLSPDQKTVYIYRQGRLEGYWSWPGIIDAVSTDSGQVKWELPLEWGGTGWQTFTSFATDANGTIWMASYRKPDPNICYGRAEYLLGISTDGYIIHQMPLEGDMDCGSHVRVGQSGTVYITYDDTRSNLYWDGTQWLQVSTWWNWDGSQYVIQRSYWDGTQWINLPSPPKGGIAAYDPVNGFKWRFELPDSYEANASPAIDANENIYFAASHGERLYSLNKDGQLNWEFNIAPGIEPSHGYNWQSSQAGNDQLTYGVAPVIGLNGAVYFMGEKNLYGIDTGVSEGAVINTVENLVQSGTLDANTANTLTTSLEQISEAPTIQSEENKVQSTINQINALENSGRLDAATADQLRSSVGQLK